MGRWDREPRKRSRSKSPSNHSKNRRKSRSRSPRDKRALKERADRERSPGHRRDRERERPRDKERKRSRSPRDSRESSPKVEDIVEVEVNLEKFDKDAQERMQTKLEVLMQKRRERVEKWRAEQAKSKGGDGAAGGPTGTGDTQGVDGAEAEGGAEGVEEEEGEGKKQWTLDDEDEEEEDGVMDMQLEDSDEEEERELLMPVKKVEEDEFQLELELKRLERKKEEERERKAPPKVVQPEVSAKGVEEAEEEEDNDVDPLDAFMAGIQAEVKKLRGKTLKHEKGDKVSLVIGVAKKKEANKNKGELLEQNQDALEYSSEDEATSTDDLVAMNSNLQQPNKKKLMTISKEDISYQPFVKNFYIEVPDLGKMTVEEVEAYRAEMEGIKIKGRGCPKPIKTWAQAGVSKKELDSLKKHNYEKPTPIQAQAIPAIMAGRDLIGIAKTGSGKTLAFLIPMFRHILDQPELEPGEGPIGVIMTPTRELATQIWSECRKFSRSLGLRAVAVYGGTPISEQIGELKPGAEIVVCTPGRMIDMLAANSGRVTNLKRCTYVVLDEADRMFDMGFEPQVMRIIDGVRPDRQTIMFSATFPRIMESLARRILNKPIEILVGGRSVVCKEIEQQVFVVEDDDKFLKLLEVLGRHLVGEKSAIVFVDKQEHADMLLKELMHASYSCLALHGGIDQTDRDSTISDFKHGRVKVLVATSVAARGLDVKQCILVVNYDCPNHYEDYVHRCGRTGRAGNKGYAYTFITPDQGRYSGDIIKAFELSDKRIPDEVKHIWDDYKRRQEADGKKVRSGGGGFSGKGFKFDEAEAQLANEKKKFQKAALGLQDSDDEDPEADIDQEIENMLAPKKSVKQISLPAATAPGTSASALPIPIPSAINVTEKLELAKRLASRIAGNLVGKASSTTEAFLKGESVSLGLSNALTAKSIAEQRAERLHAKLNYVPKDAEYNEDGDLIRREDDEHIGPEVFQRFEEELEINDFPQQARWRVTSREALAQISEYSEAGITVRGTYFPQGKDAKDGERKLYLAIEGTSELAVSKAKAEIIRLIKEELVKMQNSYQPVNRGRYKVL